MHCFFPRNVFPVFKISYSPNKSAAILVLEKKNSLIFNPGKIQDGIRQLSYFEKMSFMKSGANLNKFRVDTTIYSVEIPALKSSGILKILLKLQLHKSKNTTLERNLPHCE